ncbi:hypothetical protein [Saccharothrix xinjiangensis]|uniref:DUF3040 family protein n=1 Tax=Saccharothrix xinjiangensis TaxID=204798 RepID=A0ABV9Y8A7_9PSEU
MTGPRVPDQWSLVREVLTGEAWAPFVRVALLTALLGGLALAALVVLGPLAVGLGAAGGAGTVGAVRAVKRRREPPDPAA